jgi:hypothetical protein
VEQLRVPISEPDLGQHSVPELFALYRSILRELRGRGVVRTENGPAGDYAEFLVATGLGGTLAPNSEKSFDVLVEGSRVQVKARVVSEPVRRGQLQLSPFRSFDFDEAVDILSSDDDYSVRRAARIPVAAVRAAASYNTHVNDTSSLPGPISSRCQVRFDVTDQLRAVT